MALPFTGSAAPFISVGDTADIFVTASGTSQWSSNLFRSTSNETSDVTFTFSPGVVADIGGDVANANISLGGSYDFIWYAKENQLNTGLLHLFADGSYRGSRLTATARVYFDEFQSVTGAGNAPGIQGVLAEGDRYGFRGDGEYQLSPKFSFGAGFNYERTEYSSLEAFYADRTRFGVPLDLFYELTPKLDASVGYRYTQTQIDDRLGLPGSGYDQDVHFVNVGLRGNMTPKLSGTAKIGYNYRSSDLAGSDDSGGFGADIDLVWAITPKLNSRWGFSQDFGASGSGQQTEDTDLSATFSYTINQFFFASVNGLYSRRDFSNFSRLDDFYQAGARLSYVPNNFWRFGTGYSFRRNTSDAPGVSYSAHLVDVSASLRY